MNPTMNDFGAYIAGRYAAISTLTAGGTGDATEVDGEWIDRRGFHSLSVFFIYTSSLTATKTLSLAANLQDASDSSGTGAADFGDAYAATVQATGAGTKIGVKQLDFDLRMASSHVRIQYTPDLSHTGTDTATVAVLYVLGGAEALPAV
ncbi:MAG TPA: hypothetical protein VLT87_11010 [Thermoanaerobaculia bacterium]|nr:hypothetical protein [Thermoanaerobaculia bacterium]